MDMSISNTGTGHARQAHQAFAAQNPKPPAAANTSQENRRAPPAEAPVAPSPMVAGTLGKNIDLTV